MHWTSMRSWPCDQFCIQARENEIEESLVNFRKQSAKFMRASDLHIYQSCLVWVCCQHLQSRGFELEPVGCQCLQVTATAAAMKAVVDPANELPWRRGERGPPPPSFPCPCASLYTHTHHAGKGGQAKTLTSLPFFHSRSTVPGAFALSHLMVGPHRWNSDPLPPSV